MTRGRAVRIAVAFTALLFVAGCAAGDNNQWTEAAPAGFFAGLWHGILLLMALIVSFFTNEVTIYEVSNTGAAYNLGYVLGILGAYGSGFHVTVGRSKKSKQPMDPSKKDCDEVAARVEAKVKAKLRAFVDEDDPEWEELGEKLEQKLKDRLRKWLDEE